MILFHYTTKEAYTQILKTGELIQSDQSTTMDAAFGTGCYFTDRKPDQCKAWTVAYCWRRQNVFERVEYYMEFDIPDHFLKKCNDHVYLLSNLHSQITRTDGGKTPPCPKGVCSACSDFDKVRSFLNK
jgi:hypothetical protein